MNKQTKMMIAAAAMSGLLAGSAARSFAATTPVQSAPANSIVKKMAKDAGKLADKAPDKEKGKHDCKGKNDCKGQGGCKTGDNGCKGKNSCKGKGGCATNKEKEKDPKESKLAASAAVAAGVLAKNLADDKAPEKGKHDCKGKNDCKGQGGCKTGDAGCKGKNSCKGKGGCATNKDKEPPKKESSKL